MTTTTVRFTVILMILAVLSACSIPSESEANSTSQGSDVEEPPDVINNDEDDYGILGIGIEPTGKELNEEFLDFLEEIDLSYKHTYEIPTSINQLKRYPIIIFATCSIDSKDEVGQHKSLLVDYVNQGGSLIYLSNNYCFVTSNDDTSKSEMANEISRNWGMTFASEDYAHSDLTYQGNIFPSSIGHPIKGNRPVFSSRYTKIALTSLAVSLYESNEGPFIAAFKSPSEGKVIGIASEFFFWNDAIYEDQPDHSKAQFILTRDMIEWLLDN